MKELCSEEAGKDTNGKEKTRARMDPATPVRGDSSSGDQTVDMGVMMQRLSPSVENGQESDLSTQMPGISSDAQQGLRDCTKQDPVENLLVLECHRAECLRNRKDDMEVVDL